MPVSSLSRVHQLAGKGLDPGTEGRRCSLTSAGGTRVVPHSLCACSHETAVPRALWIL